MQLEFSSISWKEVKITTDTEVISNHIENLYFTKLENLEEMNKLLDVYKLLKLNEQAKKYWTVQ